MDSSGSGQGHVGHSCEHGDEPFGFHKILEISSVAEQQLPYQQKTLLHGHKNLTTPMQNLHVRSVGHNHSMPSSQCTRLVGHQQNSNTLSRHLSAPPPRQALPLIHKLQKVSATRSANFTFLQAISFHRESPQFTSITVRNIGVCCNSMTPTPSCVRIGRFKNLN